MKKFYILSFAFVLATTSFASDFDKSDATLTEATRVKVLTAKRNVAWLEEKARLQSLEESYKAILKAKRELVKNIESDISKISKTSSPISEKIKRDESQLKRISKILNDALAFLKSDARVVEILKKESLTLDGYEQKTELERLSLLCDAYAKLKLADSRLVMKNNEVSTGSINVARGEIDGDIAVLSVEEDAEK